MVWFAARADELRVGDTTKLPNGDAGQVLAVNAAPHSADKLVVLIGNTRSIVFRSEPVEVALEEGGPNA